MKNIIRSALRKPITVIVLVIGIVFFSVLAIKTIKVDIFPALDVPTIYVAQPYGGVSPDQMDGFFAATYQNNFLYVTGVKDIEMKSTQGLCLLKVTFYPGTNMGQAQAEMATNISRAQASLPPGSVPPQVIRFDASSIPVGQLVFSSEHHSLAEIQDFAMNRIRPMFSAIPGVASPPAFGGNQRTIIVKINPDLMRSHNLTPEQIVAAVARNNVPSAAGNVRIGDKTYIAPLNTLEGDPSEFLNIPINTGSGPTVFVRDIGSVEDAADITTGYALINGRRAVYIPVIKKADASTLDVVNNIKASLSKLQASIPEDVKLSYEFDQSVYVTNAIKNLVSEGALGALLTGLMVLLFLRDWRSVIIVVLTIPLSLLTSIIFLNIAGQTINIMTLSGLALAIGILVDQATVTIENIHQHMEMHKPKMQAIWDACKEIVFSEFLITLCILAVFAPAFIMQGIPKSMFLPMALAVGFSMIASFVLAQTLVPVLANWMLKVHKVKYHADQSIHTAEVEKVMYEERVTEEHLRDEEPEKVKGFDKFKRFYHKLLEKMQRRRKIVIAGYFALAIGVIAGCFSIIGTDILPKSNSGQFQLRIKEPDGTQFEKTELDMLKVLSLIDKRVGKQNVKITSAFVGTTPANYGSAPIFLYTSGPHEGVLQVALDEDYKTNIALLKEDLRGDIAKALPQLKASFEPVELVEKIMSQGSPTPIQISVGAKNLREAEAYAKKVMERLKGFAYLRDVQIAQPLHSPAIRANVDREMAAQLGTTTYQISRSLIPSTSSSRFTDKNFWLDPKSGLGYQVQVQVPENQMTSVNSFAETPIGNGDQHLILGQVASIHFETMAGEIDRKGPNRLVTITANIYNKDLGTAGKDISHTLSSMEKPPRGVTVESRGQLSLLDDTLGSLQTGLLVSIIVIFLLLAANFQSFKLSLAILSTIPAVIAGSLVMLLVCGATLNLQSYMGIIMSVGVSVANAILMITNAEHVRLECGDASRAAVMAANSRIRPILMTSIAMVAGMIPMASGLGEGGDQVAPLGQAVIGGLIASTFTSLLVLPNVFTWAQKRASLKSVSLDPEDTSGEFYKQNHQLITTHS